MGAPLPLEEIDSWPLVMLPLPAAREARFKLNRSVQTDEMSGRGQAIWVAQHQLSASLGIAFEWVEILPDVWAIADPRSIACNFLIKDGDVLLPEGVQVAVLTTILSAASWQDYVKPAR